MLPAKTILTVGIQTLAAGWLATIQAIEGCMGMWGDMWGWKYSGQDALEVKQNGAFTWPHLGKIDQLLLFLYVTPTVSSATLSLLFFEPISEMALPQNN